MAKTTGASFGGGEDFDFGHQGILGLCEDHLADSFAALDGEGFVTEVDEDDSDFAAVVAVDGAGGI